MAQYNFNVAEQLGKPFTDYAKTLANADRIRLASYLLELTNAVQQHATISADVMWHARECTSLFNDVDADDPMGLGYHLHNMLENLSDEFDELAELVEQDNDPEVLAAKDDAARDVALAKLTKAEKMLLGLLV